jgi:pilus assembly protein CpaD
MAALRNERLTRSLRPQDEGRGLISRNRAAWESHAQRAFAARLFGLSLAAAAASALSGCGAQYASSDPAFPGDFRERHPIVVASGPTTLDIFAVSGALDARSVENIRAFAQRYRHYGSGDIAILAPAGTAADSKAVHEIRRALAQAGVKGRVMFGTYASPDKDAAAPIRLSFIGVKAIVPTACGQWPEDLASGSSVEGWKNEPYSNFGCASQSVIAAQVDDPRDFVQPRALEPSDVAMRTRAIEAVRNGQDPRTQWTTSQTDMDVTPIGAQVGAGQ